MDRGLETGRADQICRLGVRAAASVAGEQFLQHGSQIDLADACVSHAAYDLPVKVRSMRPDEIDAAVSVWREANIARGAPHGPERTARIREKLSASDALLFVALRPGVVGMALAGPGRLDDGSGEPDPSLLHISMVFVRPAAQGTGVGLPLLLHILDVARSMGCQRVGVWTARENGPARKLYERAGMALTGKTTPLRSSLALQYESSIGAQPA